MLSYASVYVEADRAATRYLSDPTYKILHNLVSRADEYGICWPGIRTIAEDTGKSKDTVQSALDELEYSGCIVYIRRNGRDPISKQKLPNVYQINPRLFAVRPGLQAQAEACWNEHGGKPLSFPFPSNGHNHNRTNFSKPPSGTSYLNQQQQKPLEGELSLSFTPPPIPQAREEKTDEYFYQQPGAYNLPAQAGTPRPQPHSEAKQQRSQTHMFRRSNSNANKFIPQRERPVYPRIDPIEERLDSDPEEWVAERCRTEAQVSIRTARGLITHYGASKVEAALNFPTLRTATKKGGLLRWLLHFNVVDPTDHDAMIYGRPDDPDGRRYITGKYADIIEH